MQAIQHILNADRAETVAVLKDEVAQAHAAVDAVYDERLSKLERQVYEARCEQLRQVDTATLTEVCAAAETTDEWLRRGTRFSPVEN